MKKAKRIVSLLLVLLMILSFVACNEAPQHSADAYPGNSQTNSSESDRGTDGSDSSSEGISSVESNGGITDTDSSDFSSAGTSSEGSGGGTVGSVDVKSDMQGKNYVIVQHSSPETPFDFAADSAQGALVADRIAEVQKTYGCTIGFYQVPYSNDFAPNVIGLKYTEAGADIVFCSNNRLLRKTMGIDGEASAMQDLLALDHILDFWNTKKWGSVYSRETMMVNGKFYGLVPALWVDYTPMPATALLYYKKDVEAINLDPLELWEKNAWEREAMLDIVVAYTGGTGLSAVWGMTADLGDMIRCTFLSAGVPFCKVNNVSPDGTVAWQLGVTSAEAKEAIQWLHSAITRNKNSFNRGMSVSGIGSDFLSVMKLARANTLQKILEWDKGDIGVISWPGKKPNASINYYDTVAGIAIPNFAQNVEQSAYLVRDLFEGLGNVKTYDDVLRYYREKYFFTDTEVNFLFGEGAATEFFYSAENVDSKIWNSIANNFISATNTDVLLQSSLHAADMEIENNVVGNKVALEQYRQNGFFN